MSKSRSLSLLLAICMVFSLALMGVDAQAAPAYKAPLVPQDLDFTENPVDIPNPERGWYRPTNYTVPVSGTSLPSVATGSSTITGSSVSVQTTITYMVYDLGNFSGNAPLNQRPIGPWSTAAQIETGTRYGVTQPLTETAINYVRVGLERAREAGLTLVLKFTYDENGRSYVTGSGGIVPGYGNWDRCIHDCEPGALYGREWYESSTWVRTDNNEPSTWHGVYDEQPQELQGGIPTESDSCGIPGHEEKNWVQYHMWQLSDLFAEFEDTIMTIKGGIFGPWGEMHSSSYTWTDAGYHWLANMFLDYLPDSRGILMHAGGAMAWQNREYGTDYSFQNIPPAPERGSRAQRIGMFNDSFMRGLSDGLYNDNGSLSEGSNLIGSGLEEDFDRQAAMDWMRNQRFFYGGETVGLGGTEITNPYPRFPSIPYESAYMHVSHLNTSYSSSTYTQWANFIYNEANVARPIYYPHNGTTITPVFDPVYDGRNGVEFMRDRMGYRLVQREGNASEWALAETGVLEYEGKIQNVGFGYIVNRKQVAVILSAKDGSGTYSVMTDIDPWYWAPDMNNRPDNIDAWSDFGFSIDMAEFGDLPTGEYDIYLKINDPAETSENLRCIRFANKGDIWDANLGANLIGSTVVVDAKATAWAVGAAEAYVDEPVDFSVMLRANEVLPNANAFSVTVTVDNLAYRGDYEALDGFTLLKGPDWKEQADGSWQGTFMFITTNNDGNGINFDGESELVKLSFEAVGTGKAALTLDKVYLATQAGASAPTEKTFAFIPASTQKAVTDIIDIPPFEVVYSKYDLNKDEEIDLLDISIALRAFLKEDADDDWNEGISIDAFGDAITAAMCDVNGDGVVDMRDIADILAHFGPAPPELVDPRI